MRPQRIELVGGNDSTETRIATVRQPLTRVDIETMEALQFADYVVNLEIAGGEVLTSEFRAYLATEGPCGRDIGKRWRALAELCRLHAVHNQASSEIEAIRALFMRRLVDEELRLHR